MASRLKGRTASRLARWCGHRVIVAVDHLPGDLKVPTFIVSTKYGTIGADTRRPPNVVLETTGEGRMHARFGRQIRGSRGDRLDTGLLVIGDDRHRLARLLLRCGAAALRTFTWQRRR